MSVYKIIIIILVLCELIFTGLFLKVSSAGFSKKSLILKTLCSAIFVIICLTAALSENNTGSLYFRLILSGLVFSLIGDFMLHRDNNIPLYITGGLCFVSAHIFYIISFIKTQSAIIGKTQIITLRDLFGILGIPAVFALLHPLMKLKPGKLTGPVFVYSAFLGFMLIKAINLGLELINLSNLKAALFIICGALLFTVSDFTLGLGFFGENTKSKKYTNIITYYSGQILLAISTAFVVSA
ncbi:MAG: lysoplasmalogenase [Clostridia bacterium]|nr:lysoplasmalogenase [Clostridia bacterium]